MPQLAMELAAVVALVAAAFVGAIGLWQGLSVWAIAFRIMISGGLIFFFTLVGAIVLGRSILHEIAVQRMERKQDEMAESLRQDAEREDSPSGEDLLRPMFGTVAEVPSMPTTAQSGQEAA